MQMTLEALIVALRGATDALEKFLDQEEALAEEMYGEPEAVEPPQPVAQPEPDPEPPAPWETAPVETTPPQVESVSAQDIVALYQQVAQAGKKVDMLKLLSGLGVEKVGELDDTGRVKLYTQIKAEAGL